MLPTKFHFIWLGFQSRRLKCEKLTDSIRQTTDAKHKISPREIKREIMSFISFLLYKSLVKCWVRFIFVLNITFNNFSALSCQLDSLREESLERYTKLTGEVPLPWVGVWKS
jgi:hypothetical protein